MIELHQAGTCRCQAVSRLNRKRRLVRDARHCRPLTKLAMARVAGNEGRFSTKVGHQRIDQMIPEPDIHAGNDDTWRFILSRILSVAEEAEPIR